jgi:ABC-type antimicrobial peptide transport system permease subunit
VEGVVSMSFFIKQIILTKLRHITAEDIIKYAKEYGFKLSFEQAKEISNYVQRNRIDPFDKKELEKMLYDLSKITDPQTAKKANKLFQELIKSYGVEDLFN